jgi:hypothetical protein
MEIESMFAGKDKIANSKENISLILSKYHTPPTKNALEN